MTELKTLKDLKNRYHNIKYVSSTCVNIDDLKAEAIKIAKDAEANRNVNGNEFTNGRIFQLKHFFNITEEELK